MRPAHDSRFCLKQVVDTLETTNASECIVVSVDPVQSAFKSSQRLAELYKRV